MKTFAFIGMGNMGQAMLKGCLKVFSKNDLTFTDVSEQNCQKVKESTGVGNLLPIKAVDVPILVKQQLKIATKDIMQTEVTKNPLIKKQRILLLRNILNRHG